MPQSTPLDAISEDDALSIEAHEELAELLAIARETGTEADGLVYWTRDEAESILNAVENENCDGVVLATQAEHSQRRRLLSGDTVEKVLARTECDVFTEKRGEKGDVGEETPIERILLATSGGPHARLAADAHVDIVHFLDENPRAESREDGEAILGAAQRILSGVENVEIELAEAPGDVAETIVTRSNEYDKTVLGSPTGGLLRQSAFGTVPESVNVSPKAGSSSPSRTPEERRCTTAGSSATEPTSTTYPHCNAGRNLNSTIARREKSVSDSERADDGTMLHGNTVPWSDGIVTLLSRHRTDTRALQLFQESQ